MSQKINFNIVDLDSWERKEYFNHYFNNVKCTYSITTNINITSLVSVLAKHKIKTYPSLIYIVTKAINNNQNFRYALNEQGKLGYWDEMVAEYTIFHDDDKTFSSIYTEFSNSFPQFYQNYCDDMRLYKNRKGLVTKKSPRHSFTISCVPWVTFTGFNLNIYNGENYLSPIITWGKYIKENKKVLLPFSVQIHHAVADGYHTSKLINEIQNLADNAKEWLEEL